MKYCSIITIAALFLICGLGRDAQAGIRGRVGHRTTQAQVVQAQTQPWHGNNYDPAWGVPVAIVVPPQARTQTNLGWGVGGTTVTPIPQQYQPGYPGPIVQQQRPAFQPPPPWPTNTNQFGDYYIRASR